jgi:hypothetical protein
MREQDARLRREGGTLSIESTAQPPEVAEGRANQNLRILRSNRPSTPRWPLGGMLFLFIAIAFLFQATANSDRPTNAVVWGGLAFAAYVSALVCALGTMAGDFRGPGFTRWRLGPWLLSWYAIAYGIATVTWYHPPLNASATSEIVLSSVLKALWLTTIGITAWYIGYIIGPGKLAKKLGRAFVSTLRKRFSDEVRSPLTPWLLYALGTAARVAVELTTGKFGYSGLIGNNAPPSGYNQILSFLSYLPLCAIVAAGLQVFHEHLKIARFTLTILCAIELVVAVVSGDKSNFVTLIVALLIPYVTARHQFPKLAITGAGALLLIIIIPFTAAYRNTISTSRTILNSKQSVDAVPETLKNSLNAGDTFAAIPASFDYMLSRIQEIDSVAIIVQRSPAQIGFMNPAALVEAPLESFVPRAIWPGKPLNLSMQQVSDEYYEIPTSTTNAAAVTPVGDLYRYGGWLSVAAGMLCLGYFIRNLDDALEAHRNRHAGHLLVVVFWSVIIAEGGWVSIFTRIPIWLLFWIFSVALTFRRRVV